MPEESRSAPDAEERINIVSTFDTYTWAAKLRIPAQDLVAAVKAVGPRVGDVRNYIAERVGKYYPR